MVISFKDRCIRPEMKKPPPKSRRSASKAKAPLKAIPRLSPSFPVVAVGASAGGLAAFTALLKALPPNRVRSHLDPPHSRHAVASPAPACRSSSGLTPDDWGMSPTTAVLRRFGHRHGNRVGMDIHSHKLYASHLPPTPFVCGSAPLDSPLR